MKLKSIIAAVALATLTSLTNADAGDKIFPLKADANGVMACITRPIFEASVKMAIEKEMDSLMQLVLGHVCIIIPDGAPITILETTKDGRALVRAYTTDYSNKVDLWTFATLVDREANGEKK